MNILGTTTKQALKTIIVKKTIIFETNFYFIIYIFIFFKSFLIYLVFYLEIKIWSIREKIINATVGLFYPSSNIEKLLIDA
jgi:hypothetical protein